MAEQVTGWWRWSKGTTDVTVAGSNEALVAYGEQLPDRRLDYPTSTLPHCNFRVMHCLSLPGPKEAVLRLSPFVPTEGVQRDYWISLV